MTRTRLHLALAALAIASAVGAAPAQSGDPVPATEVLPDLRQLPPGDVKLASIGGEWRLGFSSEVANDGPGYLKIRGTGPGNAPMTADQLIEMSDGGESTRPGIGTMHYVVGGGHEHWHLLDFERYELRTANGAQTLVTDQKTGFCLADEFTIDWCGRNHPEYTSVEEGIGVGGSDKYLGQLEGQYLEIDETTVPDGSYLLVHRVNPADTLKVADQSDDVASVRLDVAWSAGTPAITVVNSCPGTADCPEPPPPPLPAPEPLPVQEPQPGEPESPPATPALLGGEPQPVPIVQPVVSKRTRAPQLSRDMARRLVRRALGKSLRRVNGLRTICGRVDRSTFRCRGRWRGAGDAAWNGRMRIWYRLSSDDRLAWFYDLDARRSRGGRRVVKREVRGSAARAVLASSDGSLICRVG